MNEKHLTVNDLTEWLALPKSFVYEHTREGAEDKIPHFKFGKHLRFDRKEIEEWRENHRKK
jgi:excisionase family DNA binding protein